MEQTGVKRLQRVEWVDVAKFIGIAAIVLGHTIQGGYIKKYVYSFHAPMFFYLQGVVFSITQIDNTVFLPYLKKRAKSLLFPYYVFSAISTSAILIASLLIPLPASARVSPSAQLPWEILMGYCDANRPLWFLPCSFLVSVFGYLIIACSKKIRNIKIRLSLLLGAAACGCLFLYINDAYLHIYNLIWKAETAFEMIPFFIFGYVMMEYGFCKKMAELPTKKKIILSILLISCGMVLGLWNDEAGYLGNYYGYISVFYCSAMASILGYALLAMLMPPVKTLSYIGRSTLSILLMHKFPLMVFQYLIPYTKTRLQQHSAVIGVLVAAAAIALSCAAQEIICHVCPALIGKRRNQNE